MYFEHGTGLGSESDRTFVPDIVLDLLESCSNPSWPPSLEMQSECVIISSP